MVVFFAVVALTGAVRLLLPADVVANESTDLTTFYEPVADRLLDGEGLTTADGEPALRYPPGYPLLLAGAYQVGDLLDVGRSSAADAVTLLAAGFAAVLLWCIAGQVFDRTVAWVAVGLWTLHPLHLWLTKQPNSELPYEVLLYGAVLASTWALRGRPAPLVAGCAGGLLAAATLLRPAGLLLVLPMAAIWWTCTRGRARGDRVRTLASLVATFVLVLLPWTWWASAQAGHLVVGADATEVNVVEGLTLGAVDEAELEAVGAPVGARSLARDVQAREPALQEPSALRSYLWDQVRDRPADLALLVATKAARSWYGTDSGRGEPAVAVVQASWLLATIAGGVAAWRQGGTGRRYLALVAGLVLVTWATTVAVDSIVRLMLPTLGLAAPLVANLVVSVVRGRRVPQAPERSSEASGAEAASAT